MKTAKKLCSLDAVIKEIYSALVTDLSPATPSPNWSDIRSVRNMEFAYANPYEMKKSHQLRNFLKRWVFKDDVYSPDELEKATKKAFIDSQATFGIRRITSATSDVIERARMIVGDILGEYDLVQHWRSCKWGKRAARGLPYSEAYLDLRVKALSGTVAQLAALKTAVVNDELLARIIRESEMETVSSVTLTCVPKSWKTHRTIAPDTVAGGFLSAGLGEYIRKRLESHTHINLSMAQEVHKQIALAASKDGYYATADLSKASDSFVWEHIHMLVPRSWWGALETCRTSMINVGGGDKPLTSFMLMGSGHTFPLQTVLFYAILRAIADLAGIHDRVYTFGDDLMYPSRMHRVVTHVLDCLGFSLNEEKSFYSTRFGPCFRESCGGDYYHGLDVRPFMPDSSSSLVGLGGSNAYVAMLHHLLNGLLEKWDTHEIPFTVSVLCRHLLMVRDDIAWAHAGFQPSYAGVYYELPGFVPRSPMRTLSNCYIVQNRTRMLRFVPERRKVTSEEVYLWQSLRAAPDIRISKPDILESTNDTEWKGTVPMKQKGRLRWMDTFTNLLIG